MNERCSCLSLSHGECCATCRFSECTRCTYPNSIYCKRHAPVATDPQSERGYAAGVWPMVQRSDWCGDYQPTPPPPPPMPTYEDVLRANERMREWDDEQCRRSAERMMSLHKRVFRKLSELLD